MNALRLASRVAPRALGRSSLSSNRAVGNGELRENGETKPCWTPLLGLIGSAPR